MMDDVRSQKEESQPSQESILPLPDEGFSEWSRRVDRMLSEFRARAREEGS